MTERLWFYITSCGIGAGVVAVFVMITTHGTAYVGESILWVRYLELGLSLAYAVWAVSITLRSAKHG